MKPCDFCPKLLLIYNIFMRVPTKEYTLQVRIFLYLLKLIFLLNLAYQAWCTRANHLVSEEQQLQNKSIYMCACSYIYIYSPLR